MVLLGYSYIEDATTPVPAPPPIVNGGLYTGEPFQHGAPWGNLYVRPDADTYTQNIKNAPAIAMMIPSNERPGNNHVAHFIHQSAGPNQNFQCGMLEATPSVRY
jgi:hypothetical protein